MRPTFRRSRVPASRRGCRGLTLVELLVAVALGLFILLAMVVLYGNVSRANNEMSKTNQLIENGRFAMQMLQEDVQHAGFWGPLDELTATAVPDPCLAYGGWGAGAARDAYINNLAAIPVQGYSDGSPYAACGTSLASVSAKSDVLLIRHVDTCTVGAGCSAHELDPLVQVSGCQSEPIPEPVYVIGTTAELDARPTRIRGKDCATEVPRRKLVQNLYYVANGATGIPTLYRKSYSQGAWAAEQALVEGIEAFKVEYGIDNLGSNGLPIGPSNPPDGNADSYQACTGTTPCDVNVLSNVVSVKLHILSRNLETATNHTDTKSYTVGPLAIPAANDAYKRHVFSTTVRLVNPSSRREM